METREREVAELQHIAGMTVEEAKRHLLRRSEELIRHELARRVHRRRKRPASKRSGARATSSLMRSSAWPASHAAEKTVSVVELPVRRHEGRTSARRAATSVPSRTSPASRSSSTTRRRRSSCRRSTESARGRADHAGEADRGRPHPSCPDRGDVLPVQGRARGAHRGRRRAGCLRSKLRGCPRGPGEDPGAAEVQDELRPERSQAHARGRPPGRDHGGRARGERQDRQARSAHARPRQGDDARDRGVHAAISTQLARRYGESQGVVHAIEAHHYEVQPQTVEAVLLIAADAISASRPGARGESLEGYIERLEALEEIAMQKTGVERAYAPRPAARSA